MTVHNLVIREIEEKDLPTLKHLIVEAFGDGWNLGRFNDSSDFFEPLLDTYLSIFLNSSTFGRIAEIEGKPVGAILVSAQGEEEKFRKFQKNVAPNMLALLSASDSERNDIAEHLSVSFQAIGTLLENSAGNYDSSLEFIAVTKQAQGLKIGQALWNDACTYLKSKKCKSLYLISDSACNTGFYEHNGFLRANEKRAEYNYTTGQKHFDIFVYEYSF